MEIKLELKSTSNKLSTQQKRNLSALFGRKQKTIDSILDVYNSSIINAPQFDLLMEVLKTEETDALVAAFTTQQPSKMFSILERISKTNNFDENLNLIERFKVPKTLTYLIPSANPGTEKLSRNLQRFLKVNANQVEV